MCDAPAKTHTTAVVLIPPESCWEPIQAIRRVHDRQVRRWMPHVTLVYPFRHRDEFDEVADRLAVACRVVEAFEVRLAEFRHFGHGRGSFTLWLAPEPPEALARLQAALQAVVPDCNDVARHAHGFTPHLSVGQVRGHDRMTATRQSLQTQWQPLTFLADRVSLIWRGQPPDDIFRVDRTLQLGRAAGVS
jgi:2'-5' RNA ligase